MSLTIHTLDLRAPFEYLPDTDLDPFTTPVYSEQAACFLISPELSTSIEPPEVSYLGTLLFSGRIAQDLNREAKHADPLSCTIPKGLYLFAQIRSSVDRELFTAMAIEVQKEGLWRKLEMEPRVFLRVLMEEDGIVSQVFRPLKTNLPTA